MLNYFNYFTEVEEYFQQKRGTWMLLSTLDWALIDTWRVAGIPLEVVFRGIDSTFEKWEKRRAKNRRINGLAFCLQEVLTAFEEYKEAGVGAVRSSSSSEPAELCTMAELEALFSNARTSLTSAASTAREQRETDPSHSLLSLPEDLERLTAAVESLEQETRASASIDFEQLERRLGAIEEKLLAALKNAIDDRALADLEAEADRALAPYKRNMRAEMISHLQKQFVHKRLLEQWSLPRLSLFHLQ